MLVPPLLATKPAPETLIQSGKENRARLVAALAPIATGKRVVVSGNDLITRNSDVQYPLRQDSTFFWLTGCELESCTLLLSVDSGVSTLIVPVANPRKGIWDGHVDTLDEITARYDVDFVENAFEATESDIVLTDEPFKAALYGLRDVKNTHEIAAMKYASLVSAEAIRRTMKLVKPGFYEYTLEAILTSCWLEHGLHAWGYPPIIGSGVRSAFLHYNKNNGKVCDGDLVLIDAGGELQGYTSDITRTFPANGKFSDTQKQIYEAVLFIQTALVAALKPGAEWQTIVQTSQSLLVDELLRLDLIRGEKADLIEKKAFFPFMPHGLGHYVGQDVHDTRIFPVTPLVPGNIVTIEPGIYFNHAAFEQAKENAEVTAFIHWEKVQPFLDSQFGGVRIEDIILITDDGHHVLSAAVPKQIGEIEALMAGKSG